MTRVYAQPALDKLARSALVLVFVLVLVPVPALPLVLAFPLTLASDIDL